MKKWHGIYWAMVLAALTACSGQQESETKNASATENSQMPIYRVVKDNAYPPYVMFAQGNHLGYEVDILNAIAKNQGFRVEYIYEPWDKLFENLTQKDIAISLGGTSIEDVNKEVSTPTVPYMVSLDCAMALSDDDLNNWQKKNITIANDSGLDEVLTDEYGVVAKKIQQTQSEYLILTELVKQEAQVGVGDCASLRYSAASPTFKDYAFKIKELPKSTEDDSTRLVFSVRKDQTELLNKINAGLKAIEQSGELAQIKRKWGQLK